MKKTYTLTSAILALGLLSACGENNENENEADQNNNEENNNVDTEEQTDSLQVKTTMYPLQYFTEQIGQELVDVSNILPTGADAHTFEPSTNQMIEIAEADLFLYNGADFEGYASSIKDALEDEDVTIFEATHNLDLIDFSHGLSDDHDHDHDHDHNDDHNDNNDHNHDHNDNHNHNDNNDHNHDHNDNHNHNDNNDHNHDHNDNHNHNNDHNHDHNDNNNDDHDHDNGHDHAHGEYDPHVWLDPVRSVEYAKQIKSVLIELMPEQEDTFNENFEALEEELLALDEEFQSMMEEVHNDVIVVSHSGYGYWTDRYGIQQLGIAGLSPTNEPSIQQLQDVIESMEEYGVEYVLIEPNIPTNLIETVQDETGAEAKRIHNLENLTEEDEDNDEDYMSLMRENVEVLRTVLQ